MWHGMKKISIVIPTYNEQDNVVPLVNAIEQEMKKLSAYDYEIIFIDNDSQDMTRPKIRSICENNLKVKAIFNTKNFNGLKSPYYGLLQATGDCAILMCADFQDPVEMIPQFVEGWEKGHPVVCGIKTKSKENPLMYFVRSVYYHMIKSISSIEQIEHFTGFALYDRSFLDILRGLNDPTPFLRGIVAEYAWNRLDIPYTQERRRAGKTSTNFMWLYDVAMLSFTSYTKGGLRLATFAGFFISGCSFLIAMVYLIMKLLHWNDFAMGSAPILIGVFFLGGVQLFFIGLLGEYIMSMNTRVMNRPLVIEEERINFDENDQKE